MMLTEDFLNKKIDASIREINTLYAELKNNPDPELIRILFANAHYLTQHLESLKNLKTEKQVEQKKELPPQETAIQQEILVKTPVPVQIPEAISTPVVIKEDTPVKETATASTLSEKNSEPKKVSYADQLGHTLKKSKTVAETLHQNREKTEKPVLTLHQKFFFTKELFNNNADEFRATLETLFELNNIEDATSFLEENFYRKNNWDKKEEVVAEFLNSIYK